MLLLPPSNARSSILTIGRVSSSNGALHCRNQSRISLLELPAEILTIIVLELISYPNQRHRAPKTNQLGKLLLTESRKFNLIEFKGLLSFGLTCKYIHSICKRIYQKQVVLTLPSTKHTLMSQPRPRSRRDKWGHPYKRTIETHDSVARGWSGARNVNWLFISNQASYQPRRSAMFPRLISSTARLAQSFSNLKFLCLSRLNNETILSCLERGVGKNLEALSITLSEVEDSESVLRCLSNRIARLTTISQLQALQVNDIEPVWVGLINRVDNLKEVSLQITNFNSKIVQCLSAQASLRKLEIFGGVREALPMGPGFFELLHRKFPEIEVFKCGLHFAGKENYYSGEVNQYAKALARFNRLRRFVFNHFDSPEVFLVYESGRSSKDVLERLRCYSAPYLRESESLREVVSIDFSDWKSVSGIVAEKAYLKHHEHIAKQTSVLKDLPLYENQPRPILASSNTPANLSCMENVEVSKEPAINTRKVHDVRDTIMVSFEHRWATID